MVCTRCHAPILVCCFVADLDPETYVGLACGCAKPIRETAVEEQIGRAREAQKASATA
jgi:hypothetical protein